MSATGWDRPLNEVDDMELPGLVRAALRDGVFDGGMMSGDVELVGRLCDLADEAVALRVKVMGLEAGLGAAMKIIEGKRGKPGNHECTRMDTNEPSGREVVLTVMGDQEVVPRSEEELVCWVERWLDAMPADRGVFAEPGEGTPCLVERVREGWVIEAPGTMSGKWRGRVRRNAARAVIRCWKAGGVERLTGEGRL